MKSSIRDIVAVIISDGKVSTSESDADQMKKYANIPGLAQAAAQASSSYYYDRRTSDVTSVIELLQHYQNCTSPGEGIITQGKTMSNSKIGHSSHNINNNINNRIVTCEEGNPLMVEVGHDSINKVNCIPTVNEKMDDCDEEDDDVMFGIWHNGEEEEEEDINSTDTHTRKKHQYKNEPMNSSKEGMWGNDSCNTGVWVPLGAHSDQELGVATAQSSGPSGLQNSHDPYRNAQDGGKVTNRAELLRRRRRKKHININPRGVANPIDHIWLIEHNLGTVATINTFRTPGDFVRHAVKVVGLQGDECVEDAVEKDRQVKDTESNMEVSDNVKKLGVAVDLDNASKGNETTTEKKVNSQKKAEKDVVATEHLNGSVRLDASEISITQTENCNIVNNIPLGVDQPQQHISQGERHGKKVKDASFNNNKNTNINSHGGLRTLKMQGREQKMFQSSSSSSSSFGGGTSSSSGTSNQRQVDVEITKAFWLDVQTGNMAAIESILQLFGLNPYTTRSILENDSVDTLQVVPMDNYVFVNIVCNKFEINSLLAPRVFKSYTQDGTLVNINSGEKEQEVTSPAPEGNKHVIVSVIVFLDWIITIHAEPFCGMFELLRHIQTTFIRSKKITHYLHETMQSSTYRSILDLPGNKQLMSTAWVLSAMLNYIIASLLPNPTALLEEVDHIDEKVLFLASVQTYQKDLLRQMGVLRKKISTMRATLFQKEKLAQQMVSPSIRTTFVARDSKIVNVYLHTITHMDHVAQRLDSARDLLSQANSNFVSGVSMQTGETSHQLNMKMQLLSHVASICLPLNIIAGLFGMNVTVPFQTTDGAGWTDTGMFFIIAGCMALYFAFFIPSLVTMIRGINTKGDKTEKEPL